MKWRVHIRAGGQHLQSIINADDAATAQRKAVDKHFGRGSNAEDIGLGRHRVWKESKGFKWFVPHQVEIEVVKLDG